jgi:hypothetical protein
MANAETRQEVQRRIKKFLLTETSKKIKQLTKAGAPCVQEVRRALTRVVYKTAIDVTKKWRLVKTPTGTKRPRRGSNPHV